MRAGNLYLIFVGLLLCAAGGGFAWLMWRSFDRASGQRDWREVECVILESALEDRKIGEDVGREYRLDVEYGYEFEGEAHTSDRYSLRGSPWSGSREKATRRVDEFPVQSRHPCFVDPAQPEIAVLKRDSKGPGYSLWFPLIFVVGGLGIIVGAARGLFKGREPVRE